MKKLISIFLVLQMLSLQSFASKNSVIIRSIESSDFDLKQYLNVYSEQTSYSDYQLELRRHSSERKELLKRFEQAQRDFLSSSFGKARSSYEKVVEMVRQGPWTQSDRELIHNSFIRLAQVSPGQSEKWLEEAALFAIDLNPDDKSFPPPVVQRALSAKNKIMSQIQIWQPPFWESASIIIVDGRTFESTQKPVIPLTPGLHKIEIISNLSPPDSRVLTREQIQNYVFKPKFFATGTCSSPEITSNPLSDPSRLVVFYGIDCLKAPFENGWTMVGAPKKLNLEPTYGSPKTIEALPQIENEKSNKLLWWLLAGAALTGSYLLYENSKKSDPVRPTHESGFRR